MILFHIRSLEDVAFHIYCVWHCHWADMFARQFWSRETNLGRNIAEEVGWESPLIGACSNAGFNPRRRSTNDVLFSGGCDWGQCQHMSTRGVEVKFCRSLFQSASSGFAQLRYPRVCTVFSFVWVRLIWGLLSLSLHCSLARPWQAVGLCRDDIMEKWGVAILQIDMRTPQLDLFVHLFHIYSLMRRCSKKKSMMKRWERLQPKVRVPATLNFIIGLTLLQCL